MCSRAHRARTDVGEAPRTRYRGAAVDHGLWREPAGWGYVAGAAATLIRADDDSLPTRSLSLVGFADRSLW